MTSIQISTQTVEGELISAEFASLEEFERKTNLAAEALRQESRSHKHFLSEEEMEDKRKELAELMIDLQAVEEEKKDAMDAFKARMLPLKERRDQLLSSLKLKFDWRDGDVFVFVDEDKITFTDSRGIVCESRPISEEERQMRIGDRQY